MHYCLNKEQLRQFVDFIADDVNIEDGNLRLLVENAASWQDELGCLTYLFSMILERKGKQGEDCERLIALFYRLAEQMYVDIQEFDYRFIEYLLKNIRNRELSLEEELIEIQNHLSEFRYEHTLRY
jgi:hypothetical protein